MTKMFKIDWETSKGKMVTAFFIVLLLGLVLPFQVWLAMNLGLELLQVLFSAVLLLAGMAMLLFGVLGALSGKGFPSPLRVVLILSLFSPLLVMSQRDAFVDRAVQKTGPAAIVRDARLMVATYQEASAKDGEPLDWGRIPRHDPRVPLSLSQMKPMYLEISEYQGHPAVDLRMGGFADSYRGFTILVGDETSPGAVIPNGPTIDPDPANTMGGVRSSTRTVAPGILWRTWDFQD